MHLLRWYHMRRNPGLPRSARKVPPFRQQRDRLRSAASFERLFGHVRVAIDNGGTVRIGDSAGDRAFKLAMGYLGDGEHFAFVLRRERATKQCPGPKQLREPAWV
jgi:hypothetical protein